jgi:hypothetical protein
MLTGTADCRLPGRRGAPPPTGSSHGDRRPDVLGPRFLRPPEEARSDSPDPRERHSPAPAEPAGHPVPPRLPAVGGATRAEADQPSPPARIVLTVDDLLWHKTSEDHEGRITLGLLASPRSLGVLVDDNGQSLGLRLSRAEAQDLQRTLAAWLAATERAATPC